jgi:hypothetical protein
VKDSQTLVHKLEEETVMNRLFKIMHICLTISLFVSACTWQTVPAEPVEDGLPKAVAYQTLLDRSTNDKDVTDFIANHCSPADQFQLCKEAGMALWINSDQIVKTIWLYAGNTAGFRRYRGQLPGGLTFYDPMWRVEEKLSVSDTDELIPMTGKVEVPDETSSPDHTHYWVTYKRLNLIVIYDTPGADEDAYIYAVLVN